MHIACHAIRKLRPESKLMGDDILYYVSSSGVRLYLFIEHDRIELDSDFEESISNDEKKPYYKVIYLSDPTAIEQAVAEIDRLPNVVKRMIINGVLVNTDITNKNDISAKAVEL